MKIDIIIPTYNRAYCLERAINSVLKQTYKNFNLLIIDDNSSDNTKEITNQYLNDERVSYYKLDVNKGVSAARNIGIEKSTSSWVAFLDSDDEWLEDKLTKQVEYINLNPNLPLIHGEEIWYRNNKRVNPKKIHKKSGGHIFERCLKLCLISPSAVIIKKEILDEFKGFDEQFVVCEDYDLWLKITAKYEIGFIEDPILNKFGGHEDQLSAKYFAMDYYRVKSIYLLNKKSELTINQKMMSLTELAVKAKVLINGYIKHNNTKDLVEVETMLFWANSQLSRVEEFSS